ncbi:SDR family oxidoreductase [Candidatus Dependentiae bacterium]|nr:SDR family oxidoreductase [Candidatus Dependentiae bacterium]
MKNKIILITGGSSGIGLSIAKSALLKNYILINLSRTAEQSNLKNTKNYFAKNTDISDLKQIESAKNWIIKKLNIKNIDVLINCAGTGFEKKISKITESDYYSIFDVNVKGLIFVTKSFYPLITKGTGIICNISSIAGFKGFSKWSLYCASKFAVEGFTSSLRNELREKKIRVFSVKPGSVDTPFYDYLPVSRKKNFIKPSTISKIVMDIIDLPDDTCIEDIFINNAAGDL